MVNAVNYDTTYYVIAMLKKYGIKNIVASPGTQNAKFDILVQDDEYFNCYSVIDERSAAYVASGIAFETNEPVVITCTEATASRNYLSAMTDAYYKNIPIIAITFFNPYLDKFSIGAQYIDRSVTQNDVKALFVDLPKIKEQSDKNKCLDSLNAALATAKYKNKPVHINCPAFYDMNNLLEGLPADVWSLEYYDSNFENQRKFLDGKNTMIFIGSHSKFSNEEMKSLENFALSWDIPVVCDHTSNYHGRNKILTSQLANLVLNCPKPDLVIDIGNVCGEYASSQIFGKVVWRVAEGEKFAFRFSKPVEKYFNCSEKYFFDLMANTSKTKNAYYALVSSKINEIVFPETKLSAIYIAKSLCEYIPQNSSLHLAILNSLRSVNFFEMNETVDVNCNVGGFGIDGALSTSVGQSFAAKDKKIFCLIGDLAFFYDMNILGNRGIGNNLRILVINNHRGEEFRLNPALEGPLGDRTDKFIAAAGHNKNGVKGWVQSCGMHYMSASTMRKFDSQIKDFCNKDYAAPVVFEVFTQNQDEQNALNSYRNKGINKPEEKKIGLIKKIKKMIKR